MKFTLLSVLALIGTKCCLSTNLTTCSTERGPLIIAPMSCTSVASAGNYAKASLDFSGENLTPNEIEYTLSAMTDVHNVLLPTGLYSNGAAGVTLNQQDAFVATSGGVPTYFSFRLSEETPSDGVFFPLDFRVGVNGGAGPGFDYNACEIFVPGEPGCDLNSKGILFPLNGGSVSTFDFTFLLNDLGSAGATLDLFFYDSSKMPIAVSDIGETPEPASVGLLVLGALVTIRCLRRLSPR